MNKILVAQQLANVRKSLKDALQTIEGLEAGLKTPAEDIDALVLLDEIPTGLQRGVLQKIIHHLMSENQRGYTAHDICLLSKEELLRYSNVGPKTLKALKAVLALHDLTPNF
jgi:hypothetical protein